MDIRIRKLAQLIVRYSLNVKPDTNVVITGGEEAREFILELYKEIILRGAHPILNVSLNGINDFYFKYATDKQISKFPEHRMDLVKKSQYYIGIDSSSNTRELSNVNPKKIMLRSKVTRPISDYIVNERDKIRRVTVGFPCFALAQEAEMSLNEYENFVYNACLVDWKKLSKRIKKIGNIFQKGKKVHLIGENVDLKFSIEGKNAISEYGEENMPGGEIFMAPIRESLNGWIKFEYPAIYMDQEVCGIYLKFFNGKVISASADKNDKLLKEVLKTDENSCYVGEFGIGVNPGIKKYTKNLLFDEKISGTIHLALGMAYKENGGGNDSAVHWDIVKDMTKGKIILDGCVIQENGVWKV
jgi:aminopeptidase